jgi:aspartate-semialdehyde dehydrogenase
MSVKTGILGATGLVGRAVLAILAERRFPTEAPRLLASNRATGRTLPFHGREIPVQPVSPAAFDQLDLVLFAVRNPLAQQWAPVARAAGATVVDLSSAFRYDNDVPLVVPEINAAAIGPGHTLIANPNCSTAAFVLALAPLARLARLERVAVVTFQSVSGAGGAALAELEAGVRAGLDGPPPARAGGLPPFAFNVVPHIDRFEDNGYTREEMKMVWETRKILGLPGLPVTATAVRVPVRVGHCASVNVVFDRPVSPGEARASWSGWPGLELVDDPALARYPTPLAAEGRDPVLVGRARHDVSHPRGLEFFVASDNLRKGAALNAVQIAEAVVRARGLVPARAGGAS